MTAKKSHFVKTILILAILLFSINAGILLSEYISHGTFDNWIFPVGNMVVMLLVMIVAFLQWRKLDSASSD